MSCHLAILYISVEITVMASFLFGMIIVPASWCVTFDELNYDLYALNKEIFNQLNKETTAFFKFLHRTPDVDYKMKE